MKLNSSWKIRSFDPGEAPDLEVASPDYIDYFWMAAAVPGDVHTALIDRKLVEDPFYGHNDLKCRWVEEKIWWYRTVFDFSEEISKTDRYELIFEGLDTFATVYLNGVELGSTENMFMTHCFDVTRELVPGKNVVAVKFDPVHARVKEKVQYYWSGYSKERIWTRKAQSHFGWDWGPRLVTAGIWKDVHLKKRSVGKIDSVYARTETIGQDWAEVVVDVGITRYMKAQEYEVELILAKGGQRFSMKKKIDRVTSIPLEIENPLLWWTHDLGEPHLYDLEVVLYTDGRKVDRYVQTFGIRTIEVHQTDERGGPGFRFVLNGVPIFAKGANWIPIDSFIGSVPESRYKRLLALARDGNMNMLRVWGGGIYERNVFYEECNRLGILVWQDFMFSCALYPDYNKNFMENVRAEIVDVVKRLRNHPSIAIWCGNNENDWLYEALASSGEINTPFYGEKIYHELMPGLLERLDSGRLYWPSSPYGGNDHNSRDEGDSHNWQVWHGNIEPRKFGEPQRVDYSIEGVSFKNFKKDNTLFASEFGMHASANRYTLERNIPQDQLFWGSDEMAYRNKDINHQKGILLMEGYTGKPADLDEYIAYSMLTQAEGLKFGIEHYRRNKRRTGGALIWQLNDCWPGTSWSLIDYYLLPKASYHYAKKFFNPVLLSIDHEPGGDLHLWVVNDRLDEYKNDVELAVFNFYGNKVFSKSWNVSVEGNSASKIGSVSEEEALNGLQPEEAVMVIRAVNGRPFENVYYFRDHKALKLPESTLTVAVNQEERELSIRSDVFARMVMIDIAEEQLIIEDNFFDLFPGETKRVAIDQAEGKNIPWETLRVRALNGTGDNPLSFGNMT